MATESKAGTRTAAITGGYVALVQALRAAGVPAAEVVGWLAWSVGLAGEGERVSPEELLPRFSTDHLAPEATRLERIPWFSR